MERVLGVIFCGGKALRLGGLSKMNIEIGQQTLMSHASMHLEAHVDTLALSIRAHTQLPETHDYDIIYDMQDHSVAFGLLSALKYAKENYYDAILTLPVDTPFLPKNYAIALIQASQNSDCSYAIYDGHIHGLHSLWKTHAYGALENLINKNNIFKISCLYDKTSSTPYIFTDVNNSHFLNINTPETLALARSIASQT
ncbi:MAG: molybdenum cofactor guanylyltransferase [Litorimonas sp.]